MIYSYDYHSKSARLLADLLDMKVIRPDKSTFKGDHATTAINWGCGDLPREVRKCIVINSENAVSNAIHKLRMFQLMHKFGWNLDVVPWTIDQAVAIEWLAEGSRVFARTKVAGKDGEGLVECFINDQIPRAKLYTKFIPSEREYRITVCNSKVVARQRKVRADVAPPGGYNDDIKTGGNGYAFKWVVRGIPEAVEAVAIRATHAAGLMFGGVDILWTGTEALVLEVNTAPELTPNSAKALADELKVVLADD